LGLKIKTKLLNVTGMRHQKPTKRQIDKSFSRLFPRLEERYASHSQTDWNVFVRRLKTNFSNFFRLYYQLYASQYDFYYHLEDLLVTLANYWSERPQALKQMDRHREKDPLWFQKQDMLGGVCYVDLFAGTLEGVRSKIPYFKELGLTYLHLMPLFRSPEGDNDGGYAISSYRQVDPRLGTMDEMISLATALREEGISLVLDFVFNHTSDEHEWALQALEGDVDFQEYYYMFPDRLMPDAYEAHLREIFPDEHPGAFTYHANIDKWVWTTFHSYQWDLNYANPVVFNRMAEEMLYLANIGVEVLRLDAVAFIWKEMGTDCENLPQAHLLIQMLNAVARIAAPTIIFKSEAIVHPDEVAKYIDPDECQLSYNPLLMALLWNSLATRKTLLLGQALAERFKINPRCAWVNYIRSHDDIGWTFSDEDASRLGINGYDHRQFLNEFYTGRFKGSFARGLPFQANPKTGDVRISGSAASLSGLEKAVIADDEDEIELSIKRLLLIHGIIMTVGGIPLLYLGDEVGTLNDYDYRLDPVKAGDSRWVHRPIINWEKIDRRKQPATIEAQIYEGLQRLIHLRKSHDVFSSGELEVMETGNDHLLGYVRHYGPQRVMILANFSEDEQILPANILRLYGLSYSGIDLFTNEHKPVGDIRLDSYAFVAIES
jgi:amylosucrase